MSYLHETEEVIQYTLQCCTGVIPDDEMGRQLISIFGKKSHVFRKYQRMMYWMPKFKYANPFYVPRELPDCRRELAKIAVKRMCRDLQTKISVFEVHFVNLNCYF